MVTKRLKQEVFKVMNDLTCLSCPQQNKDKDEPDKDDEKATMAPTKPPGAKRGRPQIRTPPTSSASRSVSNTPSSEGRSNGKSSKTETPPNMSNGDSKTPRAMTQKTSSF